MYLAVACMSCRCMSVRLLARVPCNSDDPHGHRLTFHLAVNVKSNSKSACGSLVERTSALVELGGLTVAANATCRNVL